MNIKFTGIYKSLTDFTWDNIPKLAVITGTNGSGKSQLLELISHAIINPHILLPDTLLIENESYHEAEISLLTSEWQLQDSYPITVVTLQSELQGLHNNFTQPYNKQSPKIEYFFRITADKIGKPRGPSISYNEFKDNFPEEYFQDENLTSQISKLFLDYHIKSIQLIAKGNTQQDVEKKHGPKPWELLNEIMLESSLPFVFNNPEDTDILKEYIMEITDSVRNVAIKFNDLSSGEKVLISLVFFLYTSQEKRHFPKILLMDEPDAHLHPSMTKQFLNVIKNTFVDRHHIRVIMTTHSPSTVALTPEENLYEMRRGVPGVTKSISKNKTISLLTEGLVIAGPGTKYFLVEDNDDVSFYQTLYAYLISQNKLSGKIPLVFIAASTTTKSGGKSQVYDWVSKLKSSGIVDILQGIIDKDAGNPASDGIHILERYSFENYLLDPIVTYAALMDSDNHPKMSGIPLNLGEEYKLQSLSETDLQQIADEIIDHLEPFVQAAFPDFDASEKQKIEIEFINRKKLRYPKWLISRRGKTLLNEVYNKNYPGNKIHRASLLKALKKTYFLPLEMLNFFQALENI